MEAIMLIKPKTWSGDDSIRWYSTPSPNVGTPAGVVIECEAVQPPSMVGRSVHVYFTGEQVTEILKILRQSAIESRR
jgi:hypothetical protein